MLRIYQYTIKLLIIIQMLFAMKVSSAQINTDRNDSLIFQYKILVNGTFDKSLVNRLIFNTQNSFIIRNKWLSFEPILNYRFGYVQPLNRPKTDLENDAFILFKTHILYQNKIFQSVLLGYENSPHIRHLENRIFTGLGVGSYLLNSKKHFLQLMLYGIYEKSDFDIINYQLFRIMPFVKGNHFFEKQHFGINYTLQPFIGINKKANHRFRSTIKTYFKLSPKLDFSIFYDWWYENIVSGQQPKEISVVLFGFSYSNF